MCSPCADYKTMLVVTVIFIMSLVPGQARDWGPTDRAVCPVTVQTGTNTHTHTRTHIHTYACVHVCVGVYIMLDLTIYV